MESFSADNVAAEGDDSGVAVLGAQSALQLVTERKELASLVAAAANSYEAGSACCILQIVHSQDHLPYVNL